MASRINMAEKLPKNTPGPYYVNEECIACDACLLAAPKHFEMNEEEGYAFVKKQPETSEEKADCKEALEACPVQAIRDDG